MAITLNTVHMLDFDALEEGDHLELVCAQGGTQKEYAVPVSAHRLRRTPNSPPEMALVISEPAWRAALNLNDPESAAGYYIIAGRVEIGSKLDIGSTSDVGVSTGYDLVLNSINRVVTHTKPVSTGQTSPPIIATVVR